MNNIFIPSHTIVAGYYSWTFVRPSVFRFRMITWVNISGFSPNLVCVLILWRSGLGLLMGEFRQLFKVLSARDTIMAGYYILTFLFVVLSFIVCGRIKCKNFIYMVTVRQEAISKQICNNSKRDGEGRRYNYNTTVNPRFVCIIYYQTK